MSIYLGIDTSNYTTSAAFYNSETNEIINCKKLLPVDEGSRGLMQSKALFTHVLQLPDIIDEAFNNARSRFGDFKIKAVCVSNQPRLVTGSYMPVFLAGVLAANSIASAENIACYTSSHQIGHVLAALYSANALHLLNERFLAFHVSGGTTECLLATPNDEHILDCEIVANSLDLKAGQAIDRVGVMLGLKFPAGAMLDELSIGGTVKKAPKITLKGTNCCLSGVENICKKMIDENEKSENVARFVIEYIYETVNAMSDAVIEKYGELPFVYAGGVMSNSIISERLKQKGRLFAERSLSSDNAVGMAIAAGIFDKRK